IPPISQDEYGQNRYGKKPDRARGNIRYRRRAALEKTGKDVLVTSQLVADPQLLGRGQTVAGSGVGHNCTAGKTFQELSYRCIQAPCLCREAWAEFVS